MRFFPTATRHYRASHEPYDCNAIRTRKTEMEIPLAGGDLTGATLTSDVVLIVFVDVVVVVVGYAHVIICR